jgi:hypothetical protein
MKMRISLYSFKIVGELFGWVALWCLLRFLRMRTTARAAIALVLIFYSVTHSVATTVLVFISPQEAVIAADSLSTPLDGGPQQMVCKIAQVSDHMLFAVTGASTMLFTLNPYDLAKGIGSHSRNPHEAAKKYADDAWYPLQKYWKQSRTQYVELNPPGTPEPDGPQSFIFVGLNKVGLISGSEDEFVEFSVMVPILRRAVEPVDLTPKGHQGIVYSHGMVENLPSGDQMNRWIDVDGAPAAFQRAIEMQSKATPKFVGGKISIVRLRRDGSINWINRGECK